MELINNDNNIVLYTDGEIELNISLDEDTIWLTQKQLAELFDKDTRTINEHIQTIYNHNELNKDTTIRKYRIVQKEGTRKVTRNVIHYNLDMIISIGYKVNSIKATKFRQWATSVLKNYITNGYTINSDKITNDRFVSLENKVQLLSSKLNILEDRELKPTHGIFYDGEIFDAYKFISDLIRDAKFSIVLIDNYCDDSVLTLFSKNQNIDVVIYTHTISKQLKQDLDKYNSQYKPIIIKSFKNSHDRFMIVDDNTVYHIGASLKDLGKKWFAFSKIGLDIQDILNKLK